MNVSRMLSRVSIFDSFHSSSVLTIKSFHVARRESSSAMRAFTLSGLDPSVDAGSTEGMEATSDDSRTIIVIARRASKQRLKRIKDRDKKSNSVKRSFKQSVTELYSRSNIQQYYLHPHSCSSFSYRSIQHQQRFSLHFPIPFPI